MMCVIKHELKIPPPYAMATPPGPPLLQCSCERDQELACDSVLGAGHMDVEQPGVRVGVVRLASVQG